MARPRERTKSGAPFTRRPSYGLQSTRMWCVDALQVNSRCGFHTTPRHSRSCDALGRSGGLITYFTPSNSGAS